MSQHLLFLSHAGVDSDAALALAQRIESSPTAREHGVRVWIDKRDLVAGQGWQRQLEQVIERESTAFLVYLGGGGVINWVEHEVRVALDRAARDAAYPFIPVIGGGAAGIDALPAFARQYQGVLRVEDDPEALAGLVRGALGLAAREAVALEEQPFLGLQAFDQAHARLFFGREQETGELVARLREINLLMVVGDSGAGKSSLVKAGLGAAFRGGVLADTRLDRPDTTAWHLVKMRPGAHPFEALAEEVMGLAEQSGQGPKACSELADLVRAGRPGRERSGQPTKVRDALALSGPPGARLLLVVDQFEELWTLTEEQERVAFVEMLLTLVPPGDFERRVVLTMRRDYYNLCSELDGLYARLEAQDDEGRQRAKYAIQRMRNGSLRRCIVEPLALAGVTDAQLLADAVLQDVGDRPGDLALLEMALTEAWRRRGEYGGDLFKAYAGIGRVAGALAGAAEAVYRDRLTGREAEAVFVRLVRLGDTGGTIRRIGTRGEFSERQWQLVQELATEACSRLLVVRGESAELSHEALASQWPRYQRWLNNRGADRRADDKRRLDGLMDEAEAWASAEVERQGEFLLTGNPLDTGLALLDNPQRRTWLASREIALLEASRAHREALAERARREARRRQRLFRLSVALSVIASVAFAAAAYYAHQLQRRNEQLTTQKDRLSTSIKQTEREQIEADKQRQLATERFAQAEAHAIWSNLVFADGKMTPADLDALWRLVASREEGVRDAFLRQLLASESLSGRFARAPEAITRALVGLDRARKDRMVETYLGPSAKTTAAAGPGIVSRAFLAIALEAPVEGDVLIAAILKTSDPGQLTYLGEGWTSTTPATLSGKALIDATLSSTDRDQLAQLQAGLLSLSEKATPDRKVALAEALARAMGQTTQWEQTKVLREGLTSLAERITPSQAGDVTRILVGSLTATSPVRDRINALGEGLPVLAHRLSGGQAGDIADDMVTALDAASDANQLAVLNKAMVAVAGALTSDGAKPVAERLLALVERTGDRFKLRALAPALAAILNRLGEKEAKAAAAVIFGLAKGSKDPERDRDLMRLLEQVAAGFTDAQAQAVIEVLLDDVRKTGAYATSHAALRTRIEWVAERLTGAQAGPAAQAFVSAIQHTSSDDRLWILSHGLPALANKLTARQAEAVAEELVAAISLGKRDSLDTLRGGCAVVFRRLDELGAEAVIDSILTAMDKEAQRSAVLGECLVMLADRLNPSRAGKVTSALITAIERSSGWDQLKGLRDGYVSAATRLTLAQAETVTASLITAMQQTTYTPRLGVLSECLKVSIGRMAPGQTLDLSQTLIAIIQRSTDRSQLGVMGKGLSTVVGRLTPEQAATAARTLVSTIGQTDEPGRLVALLEGLAGVQQRLTETQAQILADALTEAIEQAVDHTEMFGLAHGVSVVATQFINAQAIDLANGLIAAMEQTNDSLTISGALNGLTALSAGLTGTQVQTTVDVLIAAVRENGDSLSVSNLIEGATTFNSRLTELRIEMVTNTLIDRIAYAHRPRQLGSLLKGIWAVSSRLPDQKLEIIDQLSVMAVLQSADTAELKESSQGMLKALDELPSERAGPMTNALAGAIRQTTDTEKLRLLGAGLAGVAHQAKDPRTAERAADALIDAAQRLNGRKDTEIVFAGLAQLTDRLAPDKLCAVAETVLEIGLARGVQLEGLLAIEQCVTGSGVTRSDRLAVLFAQALVAAMDRTRDAERLDALRAQMESLAARVTPAQAESIATILLANIRQKRVSASSPTGLWGQLSPLGDSLAVAAGRLTADRAERFGSLLLEAISPTKEPAKRWAMSKGIVAVTEDKERQSTLAALAFSLLKYPNVTGNAQKRVLDNVREGIKDAPTEEQGFWMTVKWAEQRFPDLDLKTSPSPP